MNSNLAYSSLEVKLQLHSDPSTSLTISPCAGCGFIGRHLVTHLIENQLVNFIRVVDKVPPAMAWLNKKHREAFDNPSVEYVSANLFNSGTLSCSCYSLTAVIEYSCVKVHEKMPLQ